MSRGPAHAVAGGVRISVDKERRTAVTMFTEAEMGGSGNDHPSEFQARRSRASRKESGDDAAKSDSRRERLMKKAEKVKKAKKVQKMDLGAIFDAHIRHEFVDHDVAATMTNKCGDADGSK